MSNRLESSRYSRKAEKRYIYIVEALAIIVSGDYLEQLLLLFVVLLLTLVLRYFPLLLICSKANYLL